MSWEKIYSITADVTSQKVVGHNLVAEINSAISSAVVERVNTVGDVLTVQLNQQPNAGDETTMDNSVQNHPGVDVHVTPIDASYTSAQTTKVITEDANWEELLHHKANAGAFIADLSEATGRYTIDVKGDGGQVKIVEEELDGSNPVDLTFVPINLPNTSGSFQTVQFSTDVPPRAGLHNYSVRFRKNGATSLEVELPIAVGLLRVELL